MMKRERTSYAFLMEMLWVCAFFLIGSSIFVLSFAKAENMSRGAETLNQAVLAASNAMERALGACEAGGEDSLTPELLWQIAAGESGSAEFSLSVESRQEDGLMRITVQVLSQNDGSVLYRLEGARRAAAEGTGV